VNLAHSSLPLMEFIVRVLGYSKFSKYYCCETQLETVLIKKITHDYELEQPISQRNDVPKLIYSVFKIKYF